MIRRYWLDGLKRDENLYTRKNKAYRKSQKQIKKYGFSEVETWNMDISMVECLYERLMMFMEVDTTHDWTWHEIEYNGGIYNQEQLMKMLRVKCVAYLELDFPDGESSNREKDIWSLWATLSPYMWY